MPHRSIKSSLPLVPKLAAAAPVKPGVILQWDPSPSTNVTYRIWFGYSPRSYHTNWDAGTNLSITVPGSAFWNGYYTATAHRYNQTSDFSNEILLSKPAGDRPPPKTNLVLIIKGNHLSYTSIGGGKAWTNVAGSTVSLTNPAGSGRLWRGTNLTWDSFRY